VVTNGSRSVRQVALTFDADLSDSSLARVSDGRFPAQYNEGVIDYLQSEGLPATVFVTGLWGQTYPEAMRRLAADPKFTVGNHSWDHLAWTSDCYGLPTVATTDAKEAQVQQTNEVIAAATGSYPSYFRFPGLCHSPSDVDIVAAAGQITVDTDITTTDAFAKRSGPVVEGILGQVEPGSILLFHLNGAPNAPATLDIVSSLVPRLRDDGYEIVSLDELLAGGPSASPAAPPDTGSRQAVPPGPSDSPQPKASTPMA
jgi:peptidoglycan/xylan/chitin deacetylase (PgdA/CDA1 family)